jgi:hypothetical protein
VVSQLANALTNGIPKQKCAALPSRRYAAATDASASTLPAVFSGRIRNSGCPLLGLLTSSALLAYISFRKHWARAQLENTDSLPASQISRYIFFAQAAYEICSRGANRTCIPVYAVYKACPTSHLYAATISQPNAVHIEDSPDLP